MRQPLPRVDHLGLSRRASRERTLELLPQVGILDPRRRIDQYPRELSGGMRDLWDPLRNRR